MAKTFGEAFGALIKEKRGQEGLTQRELAIKAFDDESKVRRIIELEKGVVNRPHTRTVDPLIVYFNLTKQELEECRQRGLFSSKEQASIGLSRTLMENLAQRFEHDSPDAPDEELLDYLKGKAEELKQLKKRFSEIEGTTRALSNQIAAVNDAIDEGRFDEVDEILAGAEEIQQDERTLREIRTQSDIRFARADAALFRGQRTVALEHYLKGAAYFSGFGNEYVARRYERAAGQFYEVERRRAAPDFSNAIDLSNRALNLTAADDRSARWVIRKYHLALVQQAEARRGHSIAKQLLDDAIANARDALQHAGSDVSDSDKAGCSGVLGTHISPEGSFPITRNGRTTLMQQFRSLKISFGALTITNV